MATKVKAKASSSQLLEAMILKEIRLLRNELTLLFPQEDIKEYAHSARIKRSYQKATKLYPPLAT